MAGPSRLTWLANRFAAMSAGEIAHRAREQVRRRRARGAAPDFAAMAAAGDRLPVIPGLAEGVDAIRDRPGLLDDWGEVFERARAGRFHLLGCDWPPAAGVELWHLDPVTGRTWPRDAYCFDLDYRHADALGDVKYVWELNRLQVLQPVAALARATGAPELAAFCLDVLTGWIAANPPFRGVNWPSGIELAFRVATIAIVVSLLGPERLSAPLRRDLRATLAAHGTWLARFPSLHSSANNHRVAELAGLYLLGRLVPDLPDAAAWLAEGRAGLIAECPRQLLDDGWGAEQAPSYAALTLDWLLLCGTVGARTGVPFPAAYWARIVKAGEAFQAITDRGGHQPRIGDDDDSAVFYSRTAPDGVVTALLAAIANACARPDLAPPGVRPHLREALYGSAPGPAPLPTGVRHFPLGGVTAVREERAGREALWIMDHGPLGYLAIAAHGHADALALWLHLDGRPVLVDAGTFLYHGADQARTEARGTAAHNTLCLDGLDSSRMTGPFNWGERARVTLGPVETAPDAWRIEARHDGYRKRTGLLHRRCVERTADGALVVDTLEGPGPAQPVRIGFLVHPDLTVTLDGDAAMITHDGRTLVRLDGGAPLTICLEPGWYSACFGERQDTVRVVLAGRLEPGREVRIRLRLWP